MSVEVDVTLRTRSRMARAWVRLLWFAKPVIGLDRAKRWAIAGARRMVRVDVLKMEWRR